ncbi:MAG: hypothetical protein Q8N15_01100 [Bacillota bacterium]|nr:hypothetical protein [Bacillota bacterium]
MEELIGRKVKLILNSTQGTVVVAGELIKLAPPFIVILAASGKNIYFNLNNVKSVEAA